MSLPPSHPNPCVRLLGQNLLVTVTLLVTAVDSATQTVLTDQSRDEASDNILWPSLLYHTGLQLVYSVTVLGMRELTVMLSDPFAHGRNAIPTSRYMDNAALRTSKHANYHDPTGTPDATQDPGFRVAHATFHALGTDDGEQGAAHDVAARREGFHHGLRVWEKRTKESVLATNHTSMRNLVETAHKMRNVVESAQRVRGGTLKWREARMALQHGVAGEHGTLSRESSAGGSSGYFTESSEASSLPSPSRARRHTSSIFACSDCSGPEADNRVTYRRS